MVVVLADDADLGRADWLGFGEGPGSLVLAALAVDHPLHHDLGVPPGCWRLGQLRGMPVGPCHGRSKEEGGEEEEAAACHLQRRGRPSRAAS